ncbi:sulfite exporter TauE/SafE family protein, partial [Halomonas sp. BBD48]|nr:sulfite exporter TauE/SafE family protein [Halomonas sp. BBD48]
QMAALIRHPATRSIAAVLIIAFAVWQLWQLWPGAHDMPVSTLHSHTH